MVKSHWAILIAGLSIIQAIPTAQSAGQAPPGSTASLIAEVRERVETDRLEVRVHQGKNLVQLAPHMELFVVTPLSGSSRTVENLAERSVAIVPSEKQPDRF